MEQLISLVMDNPFIFLIVIGLVYAMFFRKSPLEKRPRNQMPDFGGGPMFPQKPRRPGTPAGGPTVVRQGPAPVERREPLPEYRELPPEPPVRSLPQETARPSWASVEPIVVPAEARTVRRVLPAAAESDVPPADSPLTGDDLTRAVVWAEILGPPRSRRPLRRT